MNKLFLAAALLGSVAIGSTAVMAEHHEGDHKGKMMERIDTDGDGMVSKAEFMAKHEEKFAKMDADSDGMLTTEEMKEAKAQMKEKWDEMKEKRKDMEMED